MSSAEESMQTFMQRLPEFIMRHWIWVAAFVVVLVLIIVEEMRSKGGAGGQLSPQQVTQLINHEEAVVIDIREAAAFREGHITNALNVPAVDLDRHISKLERYKQRPVIVVCGNAQKSQATAAKLRKLGFAKVSVLARGLGNWTDAGLPLVKSKQKDKGKGK
jgi:rhodanese-related sulfurtransferase